ncbi:MAG: DUF2182 domain-containing protein [Actinomycetota bacterium]
MTNPTAARATARRLDRNLVALAVLTASGMAWGLLALTHGSALGHSSSTHPGPGGSVQDDPAGHAGHGGTADVVPPPALVDGAVVLGAWALMVVAMMLPPALPLLQTVRRLAARRPDPWRLTALSAMTFVGAWTLVGALLMVGDEAVRALAARSWPGTDPLWAAGAVVLGAGAYQFTPLKELCLRGCRSPRSFVLAHWQGRRSPGAETVALSGAYALSCIGCCWVLMLICFTVGTAALPVMVGLTVLMAAERLVPWGRRLVRPAGLALIALGTMLLLEAAAPFPPMTL